MRQTVFLMGLVALLAVAAAPLNAQTGAGPLPPGDGGAVVAVACSQCHSLRAITQLRQGRQAWRNEVYDMILRGAQVGPDDIDTVVNYLAVHFGPGVPLPGPPGPPVNLPAGSGKTLVAGVCALCHSLDRAVAGHRSKPQWQKIVARMVYLGAPLSAAQETTVVDYLDANFGSPPQTAAK